MLDIKNIIDELKNQEANPDLHQIDLLEKLKSIFNRKNILLNNKNKIQGLYIWGDVGRGKTLITQLFLKNIKSKDIASFHYIDFMNYIHNKLSDYSGFKNPLNKISKNLNKKNNIFRLKI